MLLQFNLHSQTDRIYEFQRMHVSDTVYDFGLISELRKKTEIKTPEFFFIEERYAEDAYGWGHLFYKDGNKFLVYSLDGSIRVFDFKFSKDDGIITAKDEYYHGSRGFVTTSQSLIIIDIPAVSMYAMTTYAHIEEYEILNDEGDRIDHKDDSCTSEYFIKKRIVTVEKECKSFKKVMENCESCFPSGTYKIEGGKLIKING